MLNKSRILVFTDFKEVSDYTLVSAEILRRHISGSIHVVHVSDFQSHVGITQLELDYVYRNELVRKEYISVINRQFEDQLKKCEIKATSEIVFDSVIDGMLKLVKSKDYDIVFIGSKSLKRNIFNLGGIASKLIASSVIPVMVIKNELSPSFEKIGVLVDTTEPMDSIISTAEELSILFSAKPVIISVWKSYSSTLDKILPLRIEYEKHNLKEKERETVLDWMDNQINKSVDEHIPHKIILEMTKDKKITQELLNIMTQENISFAVMMKHHHKILDKLFIGSECRRILELYNGNLLILPTLP